MTLLADYEDARQIAATMLVRHVRSGDEFLLAIALRYARLAAAIKDEMDAAESARRRRSRFTRIR